MAQKKRKLAPQATPLPLLPAEPAQSQSASTASVPPSFDSYREQWLESVRVGNPSSLKLGQRFGAKLLTHWLDIEAEASSDDLFYCDGSKDGGIDIAYRLVGNHQTNSEDQIAQGDTWYLVQSKYGKAFQGVNTLFTEGIKVIDTLDGQRKLLSSLTKEVLEQIQIFRVKASELDHLVLVFATEEPLSPQEQHALQQVRTLGRSRLGSLFDVEDISIHTIYQRLLGRPDTSSNRVTVPLKANLRASGEDLYVGTVALLDLYAFLKSYKERKKDLNLLYEKNVRRSLRNTSVNKKIFETLNVTPDQFGLYNNGITIVVTDLQSSTNDTMELTNPSIVNGCQTTQMIWAACNKWLESGGTGKSSSFDEWKQKAGRGVVIAKVVKVSDTDLDLLRAIARRTNSQNAIREQDFLALESDFTRWAEQMRSQYGIFMEIQRGEWESQQAYQKQHPLEASYTEHANAFDLVKVYGAGWLGVPGLALGDNAPFIPPNGQIYTKIIEDNKDNGEEFGVDDLYAAYCLKTAADSYGFGKRGGKPSRSQTRYMFYMVVLEFLREVLILSLDHTTFLSLKDLTRALLRLFDPKHEEASKSLFDVSAQFIDEYLSKGRKNSVFDEPDFQSQFHDDLGSFLKWNTLGRREDMERHTPNLYIVLTDFKRMLGRSLGTQLAPRDLILQAVTS